MKLWEGKLVIKKDMGGRFEILEDMGGRLDICRYYYYYYYCWYDSIDNGQTAYTIN